MKHVYIVEYSVAGCSMIGVNTHLVISMPTVDIRCFASINDGVFISFVVSNDAL